VAGERQTTAGSGWQRFGEPRQSGATAVPPGSSQSGGTGAGWDRFGSPQRSAAPQQSSLPPVYYGSGNSYRGSSGESRAVQVAPPIVQQRAAPPPRAPAPGYSAPPASRGGSSRSSGGHSGRR
jgi:hypothetical protein